MSTSFILRAMRAVWPVWGSKFGGTFLSDEPVLCRCFPIMLLAHEDALNVEKYFKAPCKKGTMRSESMVA